MKVTVQDSKILKTIEPQQLHDSNFTFSSGLQQRSRIVAGKDGKFFNRSKISGRRVGENYLSPPESCCVQYQICHVIPY